MGRSLADVCEFVGCLPSELYEKHPNITIGDFLFVGAFKRVQQREENERLRALAGG